MVDKEKFSDDIHRLLIPNMFIGLVASALPPASGHFGARTIMAAIGSGILTAVLDAKTA